MYGESVPLPVDHALQLPRSNVSAEEAATRAVEWVALATRAIARAGEQQTAYTNRRRQDLQFGPGDLVLLSSKNLQVDGSKV